MWQLRHFHHIFSGKQLIEVLDQSIVCVSILWSCQGYHYHRHRQCHHCHHYQHHHYQLLRRLAVMISSSWKVWMRIINVLYAIWLWTTLFRPRNAAIAVAVHVCWNPSTGITTFFMSLLCDLVVKYYLILPLWPRTITLIHHTRHYWWSKSNVTWFLRGKHAKKLREEN